MAKKAEKGFTLIELLIAMAITGIVSAAIFTAFQSQQKSYIIQDDVTAMQQNLRAGMDMMVREIRMAGFDPSITLNTGITAANATSITFTVDDGTGLTPGASPLAGSTDTYIYSYDNSNSTLDREINGGGGQPAAENIQELEFFYTLADGTQTLIPVDLTAIRSIQITMLARAERADQKFVNTKPYTTPGGQTWGAYNDNFRRRLLTTTVKCRNLGL